MALFPSSDGAFQSAETVVDEIVALTDVGTAGRLGIFNDGYTARSEVPKLFTAAIEKM